MPISESQQRPCSPSFRWNEAGIGLEVSSLFLCDFVSIPTNKLHRHPDFFELCLVLKGQGRYLHAGLKHILRPGSVFVADPGVTHEIDSFETRNLFVAFFRIRLVVQAGGGQQGGRGLLVSFLAHHQAITQVPLMLHYLPLLEPRAGRNYQVDLGFRQDIARTLVLDCLEALTNANPAPACGGGRSQTLEKALAYIGTHMLLPMTVQQVAQAAGVSQRSLSRVFRDQCGSTVIHAIQREKMRYAAQLLLMRFPCKEVAYTVGFDDSSSFSRVFKKYLGTAPSQYTSAENIQETEAFQMGP